MIVTHLYRRGRFGKEEWLINKRDALSGRLRKTTIYGYHVWAPWMVKLMRRHAWLENVVHYMFAARTRVLASYQGRKVELRAGDNLCRLILEVPSAIIGFLGFRPDHDFNYANIYETDEDKHLIESGYYVRQPQGMIGW